MLDNEMDNENNKNNKAYENRNDTLEIKKQESSELPDQYELDFIKTLKNLFDWFPKVCFKNSINSREVNLWTTILKYL